MNMCGWDRAIFNNNLTPLTHEQELLRVKVQTWLARLYLMGQPTVDFVQAGERFPGVDYGDLMMVWDDFHRIGFLEELAPGANRYMEEDYE